MVAYFFFLIPSSNGFVMFTKRSKVSQTFSPLPTELGWLLFGGAIMTNLKIIATTLNLIGMKTLYFHLN